MGGGTSGFVSSLLLLGVTVVGFVAVGADDAPATLQDQGMEDGVLSPPAPGLFEAPETRWYQTVSMG